MTLKTSIRALFDYVLNICLALNGKPFSAFILAFFVLSCGVTHAEFTGNRDAYIKWQELLERGLGPLLNSPLREPQDPDIRAVQKYIEDIVQQDYVNLFPKLKQFPIRVHIYQDSRANAFVRLHKPGKYTGYEDFLKGIGPSAPQNGFIELGLTSGMIQRLRTRGGLSKLIGHEMGHIDEGHIQNRTDPFSKIGSWWDSHINELNADAFTIKANAGRYDLQEFIDLLSSMFADHLQTIQKPSLLSKLREVVESTAETHPHEGVRISAAEALARYYKAKSATPPPSEPLPKFFESFSEKYFFVRQNSESNLKKLITYYFDQKVRNGADENIAFLSQISRKQKIELLYGLIEHAKSASIPPENKFEIIYSFAYEIPKSGNQFFTEDFPPVFTDSLDQWVAQMPIEARQRWVLHSWAVPLLHLTALSQRALADSPLQQLALARFQQIAQKNIEKGYCLFDLVSTEYMPSELKQTLAKIVFEAYKRLTAETLLKNSDKRDPLNDNRPFAAFKDTFDSLEKLAQLPENSGYADEYQKIISRLRMELFQSELSSRRLPQYNPISAGDSKKIDHKEAPYKQLGYLLVMTPTHLRLMKTHIVDFLSAMFLSYANNSRAEFNIKPFVDYFRPEYDEYIAEIFISQSQNLDQKQKMRFLECWYLFRGAFISIPPAISAATHEMLKKNLQPIADSYLTARYESHQALSLLPLLNLQQNTFRNLNFQETLKQVQIMNGYKPEVPDHLMFQELLKQLNSFDLKTESDAYTWFETLIKIKSAIPSSWPIELQKKTQLNAEKYFALLSLEKKKSIFTNKELRSFISDEKIVDGMIEYIWYSGKPRADENLPKSIDHLERFYLNIDSSSRLSTLVRNRIAEKLKLQPHQRQWADKSDETTFTMMSAEGRSFVRYFGGLIALVRTYSATEQIEFIRYISGHSPNMPSTIVELDLKAKKHQLSRNQDLLLLAEKARLEMGEFPEAGRAIIINSFFAGPTGLLAKQDSRTLVREWLLSFVSAKRKSFAQKLLQAIEKTEGPDFGLIISYALAQKSKGGKPLTEIEILKALLESYGVPGIKFGQFLAFSSQFSEFREAFESFQDEALPLSYFGLLKLLQKYLGVEWDPNRFEVLGMEGTGSVKVAVQVLDKLTNKTRILNVLRSDIEAQSRYDFDRFRKLSQELSKLDFEDGIQHLSGLADLVEDSVKLEFDLVHSKEMHTGAHYMYRHQVGEWKVQSIQVHEVIGRGLLMKYAKGVSARKVKKEQPEVYAAAMRAYLRVAEMRLASENETLITDPDIHNGQFFIDVNEKTVMLLDKGQASYLYPRERALAIQLLRIVSNLSASTEFSVELAKYSDLLGTALTAQDLQRLTQIQKGKTMMDRYLNIIGFLRERGKVPQSVVNFGFEFYRLRELSSQVNNGQTTRLDVLLLTGAQALAAKQMLSAQPEVPCELLLEPVQPPK